MDKIYLAALQMIPGIGPAKLKKLITFFGSAQQAWQADRRDLFSCNYLDETICNQLLMQRTKIDIHKLARQWDARGIQVCTLEDENYPSLLAHTFSPPLALYYRGRLPIDEKLIAIVGSRRASAYGKNVAQMLAAELALAGIGVVSGAARGIDTATHQGALSTGYTIAVLGCGVDVVYPPENTKLLANIAECGCIISEYVPGTQPHAAYFPARNRIINGLAQGVVVVEAAEKSGALITADFALEEGRDVFAVPGSVFSTGSKGTHQLIKQGAKLVERASDVLEEYNWLPNKEESSTVILTVEETAIYEVLTYDGPLSIEEIVQKSNVNVSTVTYILLQLELQGLVVEHSGQRYVRTAREGIR